MCASAKEKHQGGESEAQQTYLRRADLVESDKGKGLRHHGRGQVSLGEGQRDQDAREEQLREES